MKKIKTYFLIFLIIPISYFFAACQKEKTGTDGIVVPGNISLEVHAVHHNWDVSGITIYLEKNVTDFPGKDSTIYDIKGIADGYGILHLNIFIRAITMFMLPATMQYGVQM